MAEFNEDLEKNDLLFFPLSSYFKNLPKLL